MLLCLDPVDIMDETLNRLPILISYVVPKHWQNDQKGPIFHHSVIQLKHNTKYIYLINNNTWYSGACFWNHHFVLKDAMLLRGVGTLQIDFCCKTLMDNLDKFSACLRISWHVFDTWNLKLKTSAIYVLLWEFIASFCEKHLLKISKWY